MSERRIKAYISILAVVVIWGMAGPIIKYTLQGINPLSFLVYRLAISTVLSSIFFLIKIRRGKQFRQLRKHFLLAVSYGLLAIPIGLGLLFLALDKATVLDLALVNAIGPIISLAGGRYFFSDHITKRQKVGITIVIIGVVLNSLYPFITDRSSSKLSGNILLLVYLLADSASVLIAKRSLRFKIKSANLTNLSFIIGFLVLSSVAVITGNLQTTIDSIYHLPLKYHLGVWFMALLSGNLAYYLYIRAERTLSVSETVFFNYLQPLVTIPLAIFWLKETLELHYIVGAVVIAVGIFLVEYKRYSPTN
jgi:drug/metabolite transporter (DMT)-like permease